MQNASCCMEWRAKDNLEVHHRTRWSMLALSLPAFSSTKRNILAWYKTKKPSTGHNPGIWCQVSLINNHNLLDNTQWHSQGKICWERCHSILKQFSYSVVLATYNTYTLRGNGIQKDDIYIMMKCVLSLATYGGWWWWCSVTRCDIVDGVDD